MGFQTPFSFVIRNMLSSNLAQVATEAQSFLCQPWWLSHSRGFWFSSVSSVCRLQGQHSCSATIGYVYVQVCTQETFRFGQNIVVKMTFRMRDNFGSGATKKGHTQGSWSMCWPASALWSTTTTQRPQLNNAQDMTVSTGGLMRTTDWSTTGIVSAWTSQLLVRSTTKPG